jgi:hypothetical protein
MRTLLRFFVRSFSRSSSSSKRVRSEADGVSSLPWIRMSSSSELSASEKVLSRLRLRSFSLRGSISRDSVGIRHCDDKDLCDVGGDEALRCAKTEDVDWPVLDQVSNYSQHASLGTRLRSQTFRIKLCYKLGRF